MSNQQGLASLGSVPIRYVGKKAQKTDNVAGTGLVWAQGQTHLVPPLVAQKLLRYRDVWQEGDLDALSSDPSSLGMVVVDPTDLLANSRAAGEQKVDPGLQPSQHLDSLPNLQGMTKGDIQTYAATQLNHQLDGRMSKEAMIQQIVVLANSRAAGEP